MNQAGIQDKRGYFILPQAPEESGYYTYGTPSNGAGQYTHPALISVIFQVAHRWSTLDLRRFGIGNISLAEGTTFEGHKGHKSGLEVDVRPIRKDGKETATTRFDSQYDREATSKLIKLFLETCRVQKIYFNDTTIPRVKYALHHDNHFHVTIEKWM